MAHHLCSSVFVTTLHFSHVLNSQHRQSSSPFCWHILSLRSCWTGQTLEHFHASTGASPEPTFFPFVIPSTALLNSPWLIFALLFCCHPSINLCSLSFSPVIDWTVGWKKEKHSGWNNLKLMAQAEPWCCPWCWKQAITHVTQPIWCAVLALREQFTQNPNLTVCCDAIIHTDSNT